MDDVKQVIVVRRDLNMHKNEQAAQIAHASMMFLVDNNEAERGDEVHIRLTPAEATWLSGSFAPVIMSVESLGALEDLIFRAQLADVEVHPFLDEEDEPTCAAFGPCSIQEINRVVGSLKAD